MFEGLSGISGVQLAGYATGFAQTRFDAKGGGTVYESTIADLKAAIGSLETEKQRIDEQLRALETTLRYFENREGGDGPAHAFSADDSSAHVQIESSEHTQQRIPEGRIREWPGISSTARLILMELASWADDTLIVEMSYASITEGAPLAHPRPMVEEPQQPQAGGLPADHQSTRPRSSRTVANRAPTRGRFPAER